MTAAAPLSPRFARAWDARAACRDVDGELFFAETKTDADKGVTDDAKTVCQRCEVRGHCLQYALVTRQEFGIWGGMTSDERRGLMRFYARQDAAARAVARTGW